MDLPFDPSKPPSRKAPADMDEAEKLEAACRALYELERQRVALGLSADYLAEVAGVDDETAARISQKAQEDELRPPD